jgi:PiT family inorganic phosphate transporter
MEGLWKILIPLFTSPLIGFAVGFLLLKLILAVSWDATPRINSLFKHSQIVTGVALALSHGTNDSQKTMGVITLALVTGGYLKVFAVPLWVIAMCACMIALGTAIGGWRLIRTLGGKIFKIRPVDGFAAQLASAGVIITASLIGGPVSTTQVVSSAIMGVGTGERANKVRWGVAQEIVTAWVLTVPASALVAAVVYWILMRIIH